MNTRLLFIALSMLTVSTSYGQANEWFIGPVLSFHSETRSKMVYGPGRVERSSVTQFPGAGIRIQKRFNKSLGFNTGLAYVKRHYQMSVPYNHCYFLQPGEGCTKILMHVDKYGYQTLEIPLGINGYLMGNSRLELYVNATALTAFSFQSFYQPSAAPRTETISKPGWFSHSLTSSLGVGYKLTDKIKLSIEPFVRLIHTQKTDPVLITGYENRRTYLDNLGAHIVLLTRL
jgi:hypothetical protein